ncbi:hypothetical protein H9L10_03970 [Phycicoccus endophyticus]|uniref:Ribosomal protein L7/L12 n=1 Tax=Phycicoccus endophyticus TaxID=1690220 RepID=A0A7G9R3N6_9MICO|nr:hypothetical protein [Phycicoccus endophyticus]NHI18030.1 hypothetical protein [Phycicoccus endophyticus]QNN50211.1 hypothetical protein H9L10_03970 [Phycicoccus endophyticus]GGL26983.1 hypothetical protein GCM10012283_06520 [Phycicoccus endophyticus]
MFLLKLLLLAAVVVAVWYVVRAVRSTSASGEVSFAPVETLPAEARQVIDAALARGETLAAARHYRAATGAGLAQSRAAVETYRWKQGGPAA